jgi:streptomycin 6-kinase
MLNLPDSFIRTIQLTFKEAGAAWLDNLPALIAACESRWSIRVLPPFPNLSYNFVAPAVRADGSDVVLKLGVPNPELLTEIAAMRLYDGHGIARLLEADPPRGIQLFERLLPGTPLTSIADDDEATRIAALVMRDLWTPLPADHTFPSVADWIAGLDKLRPHFDGGTGPFPAPLLDQAERLFAELLASSDTPMLLHGDLHHDNILMAQRSAWLAIDPKGITGEPAYEVGALMRNPIGVEHWPDLRRVLSRRFDILHEMLGFDRQRMIAWSFAQAVLSAWWFIEDGYDEWEFEMILAEHFAALLENKQGTQ